MALWPFIEGRWRGVLLLNSTSRMHLHAAEELRIHAHATSIFGKLGCVSPPSRNPVPDRCWWHARYCHTE